VFPLLSMGTCCSLCFFLRSPNSFKASSYPSFSLLTLALPLLLIIDCGIIPDVLILRTAPDVTDISGDKLLRNTLALCLHVIIAHAEYG
ncbi:MAG: hypothetical protein WCR02_10060, partial [Sphaerochaetaceae bacterium]